MNQMIILDITFTFGAMTDVIHPVILKDDQEMILVDCGYPGFLPNIKAAAKAEGVELDSLTKVVVTHHDYDHMGALAEIKKQYPSIKICGSPLEANYISGKKRSLRLQQAEDMYHSLPEDQKEGAKQLQQLFASVEPAPVDILLHDHELLQWCGGIEIIPTPGHMPGHISLYIKQFKTLISGDALAITEGKLGIANPEYTLDLEAAKESIRHLLDYDIESILCYHGGLYQQDVRKALKQIL